MMTFEPSDPEYVNLGSEEDEFDELEQLGVKLFEKGLVEGLSIASRFISLLNEDKFKDEATRDEVAAMILELRGKP